ncbi:penicillin-binding transpeptidase domain-containing protein [Paenibacillus lautus]|uniref:penicillin-binding transpeptidase domain-containing protein n=1 Tax=Paenibacillus lautus TaxID=1401 RepID=UPI002DB93D10|nr:penicillin-binding transpeptidase domain-containing protein [Paenibacillus lautus]MEC0258740.1 penicillin-binding transpeptidase domain-containing protein [Paenibacillus lautus]
MHLKWVWVFLCLSLVLIHTGCDRNQGPDPEEIAKRYVEWWEEGSYESMYDLLSHKSRQEMTKEEFITRFQTIYEGIGAADLTITPDFTAKVTEETTDERVFYPYDIQLETSAGRVQAKGSFELSKEDDETEGKSLSWRIVWHPSLILPAMNDGDKVNVQTLPSSRGEILDRNGHGLAINGTMEVIGIVPGKLGDDREQILLELAERLGVSTEIIKRKLDAAWVKDDLFVPILNLNAQQSRMDYSDLAGVVKKNERARVYPYGAAAAHLTGYIRQVTKEDLTNAPEAQYGTNELIGKSGSEQVYNEVLRGRDGKRISIVDSSGKVKDIVAEKEAVDGQDIQLTIDAELQQSIFASFREDAGTAAAINPKTGEILALVNSPSYDPNAFIVGLSTEQWDEWNHNPDKPLLNRFTKLYAPGSVFKPITAAIGLKLGVTTPGKVREIHGLRWSKDPSWGNYYVTRVKEVPVLNLRDALVYSDNIYLAQEALEIGADPFLKEAVKFGFEEGLPLQFPFPKASLANEGIKSEIQLADSGYGQGEVLMSPLHLALAYTPFMNGGKLIQPVLDSSEQEIRPSETKEVLDSHTAEIIKSMLVDVVQDPKGSGHGADISDIELAGKTGTAELKISKAEKGQENGWFVAFDTTESKLLLAMMVEHVEGRGGSGYVVNKVAPILQKYYGNKSP